MWKAAILTLVLLGQVPCNYVKEQTARRDKAEAELEALSKNMPLPKFVTRLDSEKNVASYKVFLSNKYKASTGCGAVHRYFSEYFKGQGWRRADTWNSMIFQKDEYHVAIDCEEEGVSEVSSKVYVSFSWGIR